MKAFKNLSISFKIITLSAVLAAVFLGSSYGYAIYEMRENLTYSTTKILKSEITTEKGALESTARDIEKLLLAIRNTPPFQGIIRANKNNGFDLQENSTLEQWRARLGMIFRAQISANEIYSQLRYIDENGMEVVRVDDVNGSAVIREDLQNKSDRYYLQEAQVIGINDVYSSKIDLNREGNPPRIIKPLQPVIRYAVKIIDEETGENRGILIANINFKKLLAENKIGLNFVGSDTFIIDDEGNYLSHPDPSKEFGGPENLNTGANFYTDYPKGHQALATLNGIYLENDFSTISEDIALSSTRSTKLTVVTRVPNNVIFSNTNKIVANSAIIGLATFVLLFFVFLFVIKRLLSPLHSLTDAAEQIGQGNLSVSIPVHNHDEIGRVAHSFQKMTEQLRSIYGSLEEKIKDRTKDLDDKVHEIQMEKAKIETILESIGDGVFVIDKDQKIVLYNRACEPLTGFTKQEAIGRAYTEIFRFYHQKNNQPANEFMSTVLTKGLISSMSEDTELLRKDNTKLPVADSAAPLKDAQGQVTGAVVVLRDVTREREVDKAKSEFVSLASHQLRTPLTSIKWNAEMLKDQEIGELSQDQQSVVADIVNGNQRMIDLVNALLNVSRLDLGTFAIEPEPISYAEIAESVIKEHQPQLTAKKIEVAKQLADNMPKINADKNLIRIIFQNLISNAIKYSPEGSAITVKVTFDDKNAYISVADNGFGIPKAQQNRIFSKLFRADNVLKKDVDGTGLGLYLIKSILNTVGGTINFQSEENVGTTFNISMPLTGMQKKEGSKGLE